MNLLEFVTIIFPGIISAKLDDHFKKNSFHWSSFLENSFLYMFLINWSDMLLIRLRGWNTIELNNMSMQLLVKYLLSSLLFSILYPILLINIRPWIKNKITAKNFVIFKILGSILLFCFLSLKVIRTATNITFANPDILLLAFILMYLLIVSLRYLYENAFKIDKRNKTKLIKFYVMTIFLLSFWLVLIAAKLINIIGLPMATTSSMLCIIGINIILFISIFSLIDIIKENYVKLIKICKNIYILISPILSFIIVELMVERDIYLKLIYVIGNLLIYYCIYLILYGLLNNPKLTLIIGETFFFFIGAIDYFVISFRGNPVISADIWSWRTALSVSNGYVYNLTFRFIIALSFYLLQLIIINLLLEKKSNKYSLKGYLVNFLKCSLSIVFCVLLLNNKVFDVQIDRWAPITTYKTFGTVLSFYNDSMNSKVEMPEGYSAQKVQNIMNDTLMQSDEKLDNHNPNIIAIMDEAFSDLSVINDLPTSEDYMPFIHSLTENTIKGNLLVSIHGGGTSNTEFEFLTGNSMAFLPAGSIPYQQFIRGNMNSISTILKSQNYTSTGIHPFHKYGYRRYQIYPLLGLDTFYDIEDFLNPHLIRGYISDEESFKKVIDVQKSNNDSPSFIFNVTMQNHGGYSGDAELDNWIHISDNTVDFPSAEEYLTLIKSSDEAFDKLISYYKNIEEPTIILLFGDHQPALDGSFYEYIYGDTDRTLLENQQKQFTVPFVIWANYDIEEKDKEILSANYLSSYLLDIANVRLSPYNQYLLNLHKKIPAMNVFGYLGDDGNWYYYDAETKYTEDLNNYQYIQYNNMFGNKNKINDFFEE